VSAKDILSQEEIDALLHSVDSGGVETETDSGLMDGEASAYDFANQDRIVRGRLPTLEMINERFLRYFRVTLFKLIRRPVEMTIEGVKMVKFSEWVQSLYMPASLSLVRVKPLRGTGIVMLGPKLVFSMVEHFFGGSGRFYTRIEGREYTAMELRIISMIVEEAFADFEKSWQPVLPIKFELQGHEVNPQIAQIVGPSEVVMVCSFNIELEGGGGLLELTLPYSMIEPVRDQLEAGVQADRSDSDSRWDAALREQLVQARVELSSTLCEATISLRQLAQLKAGDVIPIEKPGFVNVEAEGLPVMRGRYGQSRGHAAVRIERLLNLPRDPAVELAKLEAPDVVPRLEAPEDDNLPMTSGRGNAR
jgi:flagellar motor switch protein FliM